MAVQKKTLSNRTVAALEVDRDTVFWDRDLTGFGVRVYPSGGKVDGAQARERTGDKLPRRVTVGRHGVLNADEARQRAALIIARIKAGEEPRHAS
ncbi:MAG: integrase arm-type DNA-binding domain-containing protein [Rhodospirillaceae bacterium]|nr:integrase arm-type DNA-binding domain-containing protein [Rhodospirillaceae bacterium]